MKKNQFLGMGIVLFALGISSVSHALVQFGARGSKEIKGVILSDSIRLEEGEKAPALKRVTQGLRQKKVVLVWASVYVAQYFSNSKIDFSSLEKLKESLVKGAPVVVSMTFVRDVGIEKIIDGFKDVLKENKIDIAKAPFTDFLDAVKKAGDVKDQQTYFFSFSQDHGKEAISFQTNGKEYFSIKDAAPGLHDQFLNLWFGKPVDSGLEQLQEQVLKP